MLVHLKSLTIKGFKSFAEPVTLEFEPGVMVVVGPNGSGKSNVVDAVAWVLGAQGPRTLRSAKMEDVIFAGTPERAPLGRAEVTLTLDNSDGELSLPLNEVSVTRTLFRNGESEYAINRNPCRLLDVQELLSDAGVGRTQHLVVSQGQLEAVLDARPEERRLAIEEAAGVIKYRRRRERTERRLEATDGDLSRATDLVREVHRQLRPLRRQAEAAHRHEELVAERRRLQLQLVGMELEVLDGTVLARSQDVSLLEREEEGSLSELSRIDSELAIVEQSRPHTTDQSARSLRAAQSLAERARGAEMVLSERSRSLVHEASTLAGDDLVTALQSEAGELAAGLLVTGQDMEALRPMLAELNQAGEALEREKAMLVDQESVPGRPDGDSDASAETALREKLARLETLHHGIARDQAALDHLRQRSDAAQARLQGALGGLEESQALSARLVEETCEAEKAAAVASQQLVQAEALLARRRDASSAAEGELRAASARADALESALVEASQAAGAGLLASCEGLLGSLAEVMEVQPGWERAVVAALGEVSGGVLVKGIGLATAAAEQVFNHRASVTLVPLTEEGVRPTPFPAVFQGGSWPSGSPGPLPLLERVRPLHPDILPLLVKLLGEVDAVEGGWEQALAAQEKRPSRTVVSKDGQRIGPVSWSLGGPSRPTVNVGALREAKRELEASEKAAAEARSLLGEAEGSAKRLAAFNAESTSRLSSLRAELAAAEASDERFSGVVVSTRSELDATRAELEELFRRVAQDSAEVEGLEAALPSLRESAQRAAIRAAESSSRASRAREIDQRAAGVASALRDLQVRAAAVEERRRMLEERSAAVESRLEVAREAALQDARRKSALEARAAVAWRLALQARRVRGEASELAEALQDALAEEERIERRTADRLGSLRRSRAGIQVRLSELRERLAGARLARAEAALRLEAAVEGLRRELDASPEEARTAAAGEPTVGVKERLARVDAALSSLGPVNQLARTELASLEERSEFLESQLEDVRGARRELAKVISGIDEEMVAIFGAAFAEVQARFSELVATLFPGGSGSLKLTDPSDLLGTGVEIEARPGGKSVKRLSLLSGGERSLVALAFLFSLSGAKRTPFYLMDEVEAALDDVNLSQFLALVGRLRLQTQLVLVTHQKRTMEIADRLFGVTVQPGTSSKVVTERLEARQGGLLVPG